MISDSFMISFDALSNQVAANFSFKLNKIFFFHYTKIILPDKSVQVPFRFTSNVIVTATIKANQFPPRITGKMEFFLYFYISNQRKREKITFFLKPLSECSSDSDFPSDLINVFMPLKLEKLNFKQILTTVSVFYQVA